jgi:UDP-N-acetylglucosamine 4,6-dehydratase
MHIKAKTILITGGTGSLGQELVYQLLKTDVGKIIVFSRDEYKQFKMRQVFKDSRLRFFIGNVRDQARLEQAFRGVDTVIHAAALKQADLIRENYQEAVKTNIDGTSNVVNAAIVSKVKEVIFVSSDKAVNPVNLYGATKMVGEQIIRSGNVYSGGETVFNVVRSGNIINSRGSFTELLWTLKRAGKTEVPLVNNTMRRYWITGSELALFILSIIGKSENLNAFIPPMYDWLVTEVAECIIPECTYSKIHRGDIEKQQEELVCANETAIPTIIFGGPWLRLLQETDYGS